MVYEHLKYGGSIIESKEHDGGFKQAHGSDECSFPLVLLSNENVVVPPLNVKLGKQDGFLYIINEFWNEGKGIGIVDSVGVQVAIILAGTQISILLWYKEKRRGLEGF